MSVAHLLDIGRSALMAAQFGLEVTGNNIANVNNPAYSRQRIQLSSAVVVNLGGIPYGTGVDIQAVQRIHDAFLGFQLYASNAGVNDYQLREQTYLRVQSILYPSDENHLGQVLDEFFNAWQDLAGNPSGPAERQVVLSKGEQLASAFHLVARSLQDEMRYSNSLLEGYRTEINNLTRQIAEINRQLSRQTGPGSPPNDLLDQRDALLKELSGYLDITVVEQDGITVNVLASGSQPLVEGTTARTLELEADPQDNGYYRLLVQGRDITDRIGSGKVKAVLETRSRIAAYSEDLDLLASTLAEAINQAHGSGYGLDGSTGTPFFSFDSGHPALTLQVAITDPNRIAAAQELDPDTLLPAPGDNRNALALAALRDTGLLEGGTTTLSGYYQSLLQKAGTDAQEAARMADAKEVLATSLQNYRDQVSGVSLEEEEISLIKFQHAYQAATSYLKVVNDVMADLFNLL